MDDFEFYGLDYTSIRPIKMNVFMPPKYVGVNQWVDKLIESICLGYGFGTKMMSVLKSASRVVMILEGVLIVDDDGVPQEFKIRNAQAQREFDKRMAKVTLSKVYQIVQARKNAGTQGFKIPSYVTQQEAMLDSFYNDKFGQQGEVSEAKRIIEEVR